MPCLTKHGSRDDRRSERGEDEEKFKLVMQMHAAANATRAVCLLGPFFGRREGKWKGRNTEEN